MLGELTAADTLPILYSFRRCPYAMRARLAVQASNTPVVLREIVLRDKAPELLSASPKGTVPVLVTEAGMVIEESLDIMLWALERHDPEGWLAPEMGALDEMLELIERCDGSFKQQLDRYKYAPRDAPERAAVARDEGARFLTALDQRLREGAYLFGGRMSLADAAILPFVRQFANVDRDWFDAEPRQALQRWLEDFLTSERFASVMKKLDRWQSGDSPIIFGQS